MTPEELVKKVKEENPGCTGKKLQIKVGDKYYRDKVKTMYDTGYKISEICKETGLQESTVRNLLK